MDSKRPARPMKSDLSESHNSVSKPSARRRVGPRGLLSGAERAAQLGSRGKSQIPVSKTCADLGPGGGAGPCTRASLWHGFKIDPLLRRSVYRRGQTSSKGTGYEQEKLKPRYPTSGSRAARAELPAPIGAYR
jgi:hypothetical protein